MIDNKIIALGGVGRSGTTILSKIIGSLENVELFFEPKTIDLLFALIGAIESRHWKLLFKRNLYDELLINSLTGRNLNINKNDDSCIYNYKSESEVSDRIRKSYRQIEIEPVAKDRVIAFKILHNIVNTNKVKQYVPGLRPLFIIRNPKDTLNSLLKKSWLPDKALLLTSPDPASITTVYKNYRIPNYVAEKDYESWLELPELARYAYYYCSVLDGMRPYLGGNIFVDYDIFVENKNKVLAKILEYFKLRKGKMTNDILSTIRYRNVKKNDFLLELPSYMKNKMISLYDEIRSYAIMQ